MSSDPLSHTSDADLVGTEVRFHDGIEFDNGAAFPEGWGIFECSGSANGVQQLCRLDAENVFPDDNSAWKHVTAKVAEGSAYHRGALDYIRAHNPIEWASFGDVHGEPLVHPDGTAMLDEEGALLDRAGVRILSEGRPMKFHPHGGSMRTVDAATNPLGTLIAIHNEKGLLSIETDHGVPVAVSTEQFPIDDLRKLFGQFAAAPAMSKAIHNALEILEPAAMVAESHGAPNTASTLRETLADLKASITPARA